MFEGFTQSAHRVIFFARYEASQYGSLEITTEHLLLGLVHEAWSLFHEVLAGVSSETICKAVEARAPIAQGYVSTSVDMPISNQSKSVLKGAQRAATQLNDTHIGTEHLLLALLNEQGCLASQILREFGLDLVTLREKVAQAPTDQRRRWNRITPGSTDVFPTDVAYSRPRHVPEDIPPEQGALWGTGYVRRAESLSRLFYWKKQLATPRDALKHRQSRRVHLYTGQTYDEAEFELVKGGWVHDHCVVCWHGIYQPQDPEHSFGYTNGQDWLCERCYEIFVAREARGKA